MTPGDFNVWLAASTRAPLVMGVLNVTPDSFSDGGKFASVDSAVAHAERMAAEGADLIDIGGESTRPGSKPVDPREQIRRVVPVIQQIAGRLNVVISIDTTQAPVAQAALEAGAHLFNDISAGRDDPNMLPLAAKSGAPIILMHMKGTPATMQKEPAYHDIVAEVKVFLKERMEAADRIGIDPLKILLDPGIGFGKTLEHNLELLRRLGELTALSKPLVVGTSRKSFISRITGESEPSNRLFGTAASVAWSVANGAGIVRVHDVEPMAAVLRMIQAIQIPAATEFSKP